MGKFFSVIFLVVLVLAAGIFLQKFDFPITAMLGDSFRVKTSAAVLVLVLLVSFVILYVFIRLLTWLKNSPKRIAARIRKDSEAESYKNITRGFSALASGDMAKAKKFADKSHKALPNELLLKFLEAQIAVKSGESKQAEEIFSQLAKTEDAGFIGYRGLISLSVSDNKPEKALQIADDLLKTNPKSSWLNGALVDLGFRNRDWDRLEKYLKKAEANKSLEKDSIKEKFSVYYYEKAKIAKKDERFEDAEWLAERALKYQKDFLPAAIFLAELFVEREEYKKAKNIVEDFWEICPHPDLAKYYEIALINRAERVKHKFVRKLYEKNPDDVLSAVFYAKTLIEADEISTAKEVIQKAMRSKATKSVCLAMAQIDDKIAWQNKAETALEDKIWHCKITGARYNEWKMYSDSGELNTIVWGYPPNATSTNLGDNKFLLIN